MARSDRPVPHPGDKVRVALALVSSFVLAVWFPSHAATAADQPGASGAAVPIRTESAKLVADDNAFRDQLGAAVAISGDTVIAGAPSDDDNGVDAGSAYVFVRDAGGWAQEAELMASDGLRDDMFGISVAIDGDTAVVGAHEDDDNGAESGSAYVFVRVGGVWTEQAKLLPADGGAGDRFGWSVALAGDTAVVTSWLDDDNGVDSGSAYVFERSGTLWSQQAKLTPSDGSAGDEFGIAAAISGETAVIGAWKDGDNGTESGSAYVFERSGTVWSESDKLLPADGAAFDRFGGAVDVDGVSAVVGAYLDDDNGSASGSAYVFARDEAGWVEQAKLLAEDGAEEDLFGWAVGVSGAVAVVSSWLDDDNGDSSGSAYAFDLAGDPPAQVKLLASDGAPGDQFGYSAAVEADTAVVGAWLDDDDIIDSGAAYVYEELEFGLRLSASGSCPGSVDVTIAGGPPNAEVGVIAAANTNGWVKGGARCAGTRFEVGEPFQLPPVWVPTDANGMGAATLQLGANRCWLEAIALVTCETSGAVGIAKSRSRSHH